MSVEEEQCRSFTTFQETDSVPIPSVINSDNRTEDLTPILLYPHTNKRERAVRRVCFLDTDYDELHCIARTLEERDDLNRVQSNICEKSNNLNSTVHRHCTTTQPTGEYLEMRPLFVNDDRSVGYNPSFRRSAFCHSKCDDISDTTEGDGGMYMSAEQRTSSDDPTSKHIQHSLDFIRPHTAYRCQDGRQRLYTSRNARRSGEHVECQRDAHFASGMHQGLSPEEASRLSFSSFLGRRSSFMSDGPSTRSLDRRSDHNFRASLRRNSRLCVPEERMEFGGTIMNKVGVIGSDGVEGDDYVDMGLFQLNDLSQKMEQLMGSIDKQNKRIDSIHEMFQTRQHDDKKQKKNCSESEKRISGVFKGNNTYQSLADEEIYYKKVSTSDRKEDHSVSEKAVKKMKKNLLLSCVK